MFWLLAGIRAGAGEIDYVAFLKDLRVPRDFTITLAAGEPLVRFPMFACFDDEGRLYVAESSGRDLYAGLRDLTRDCLVSRLEDTDGDGRFDTATVFQDRVTFPMGLAWREGRLYLADPPDLVALTDTNGDGRADHREVILTGFGHTDNGSLHGLTFGPDGFLYFTMGAPDGWKLPRGDGTFLEGRNGALFRCQLDGSRPEVISRGFVNLVEVEFLPGGDIIGTDNWYQRPAGGYRDALVHCVPGGLFPYEPDHGTPLPRTGILLPPLTLLPAVAHSGLTRLRGSGFPPEWRSSLWVAEHNTRKLVRHELRSEGSSFAATRVDFIVGEPPDFHPSDALEDADGSLLVVDTGGWYVEHCPTGSIQDSRAPGGIYRVRWNHAQHIADPRGRSLKWAGATVAELAARLADARPLVAGRAASELASRHETAVLVSALDPGGRPETRLHALWALARLGGDEPLTAIRAQLTASDPAWVGAAVRALALREDKRAGPALLALLDSTNAPVRRAALETLAVCGAGPMLPRIVTALATAVDDFERHACILTLASLADEPFVRGLTRHESPRARQAALNLLDHPPFSTLRFSDLALSLDDVDPAVRATARDLLRRHSEWGVEAAPWLRGQFDRLKDDSRQAAPGELLVAFHTNGAVRGLISELLGPGSAATDGIRSLLLNLLPSFSEKRWEEDWVRAVQVSLTDPALRAAALNAAAAHPRPELIASLTGLADDPTLPTAQRLQAARGVAGSPTLSKAVFALALGVLPATAAATDRLGAMDLLARSRLTGEQARRLIEALLKSGTAVPDAFLLALARATDEPTRPLLARLLQARLQSGWAPSRATLDQALVAFPVDSPVRAPLLDEWQRNTAGVRTRLNEYTPLLAGGDPGRGRELFAIATCAGCHRIGDRGGAAGPDLTRIGAIRSAGDLLESLLYPSRSFSQGYEPHLLTRHDGEELSGSLDGQDPEGVSLRDATGVIHRIPAGEIAALVRQESSAMPEGLERLLTREQFRDLLAYLQSLK